MKRRTLRELLVAIGDSGEVTHSGSKSPQTAKTFLEELVISNACEWKSLKKPVRIAEDGEIIYLTGSGKDKQPSGICICNKRLYIALKEQFV